MPRREINGLRIAVTGASSGIGRELAWQLAARGAQVIATARRHSKLNELAERFSDDASSRPMTGSIQVLAGDITDADFRNELVAWCEERWHALDVLINNAGAGAIGKFTEADSDRMRKVMELDFFAPVELTRLMLPLLRRGHRPAIMNIGSVLSHRAVPFKSEYCAAKFALRGWSEAVRCELAREKIEVLQISPSTTRSEFFDSMIDTDSNQKSRSIGSMSPKKVASIAIAGLVQSRREIIVSLGGKVLVWSGRFFPNLLDRILSR
jgi:short-subunit dehydrogenase